MSNNKNIEIFTFIMILGLFGGIFFVGKIMIDYSKELSKEYGSDAIDQSYYKELKNEQIMLKNIHKEDLIRKECYYNGSNESFDFDLIEDYNLTCKQIEYINNHFIDEAVRKNGGSKKIVNFDSGLFSSTRQTVEVKLYDWVVIDKLPTDQLLKHIDFHSDCNGETLYWETKFICSNGLSFPDETSTCYNGNYKRRDTKNTEFYTEADFIMYYVRNCIKE